MTLPIKEKMWYEGLPRIGLDECDANLIARLKCLIDNYKENNPEEIVSFTYFLNNSSPLYKIGINSGRLSSAEIDGVVQKLSNIKKIVYKKIIKSN